MFRRLMSYGLVVIVTLLLAQVFHPLALLQSSAQGGCRTFTETGKTVCGRFLDYWTTHGGLSQQGFPISSEFTEVSDLNGQPYTVQYFERSVFEKHPENVAPNDVLLSQLGTFQFKRKYPGGEPSGGGQPTPAPTSAPAPNPSINGQTIEFAGFLGKGKLRGTVTSVKETKDLETGGTARGKFVVVYITVTNMGTTAINAYYDSLKLKDGAGRVFNALNDFSTTYDAAKACGCASYTDQLPPGVPTPMVYIFDVATDASNYFLVSGH